MTPIVVWAEICVRDLAKATEFYEQVFQYETKRELDGPLEMISFVGDMGMPSAHLIQGTPAKEGRGAVRLCILRLKDRLRMRLSGAKRRVAQ